MTIPIIEYSALRFLKHVEQRKNGFKCELECSFIRNTTASTTKCQPVPFFMPLEERLAWISGESYNLEPTEEERQALRTLAEMGKAIQSEKDFFAFLRRTRSTHKKSSLGPVKNEILRGWVFANEMYPYPSPAEKLLLMRATGLDRKQLRNWFSNMRKREFFPGMEGQPKSTLQAIFKSSTQITQISPKRSKRSLERRYEDESNRVFRCKADEDATASPNEGGSQSCSSSGEDADGLVLDDALYTALQAIPRDIGDNFWLEDKLEM